MMGTGKTSAAIRLMNLEENRNFIFITPFKTEVKRICEKCSSRHFVEPYANWHKNKLQSLKEMLEQGRNISSTHALFQRYDGYTESLLRSGKYTLILDEVTNVVEVLNVHEYSVGIMLRDEIIKVDDSGHVFWQDDNYPNNDVWSDAMRAIKAGHVIMSDGKLMIWQFPISIFDAFEEVIILTYMFDAQLQKYYYDLNGATYQYIGVEHIDGEYRFIERPTFNEVPFNLSKLIHIIDDERLNEIGDDVSALSVRWHERSDAARGSPNIARLKANVANIIRNRWNAKAGEILWTTFMTYRKKIAGKGYTNSFLEYNARAKNEYRERIYLMYLVNVYMLVDLKRYFVDNNVNVLEDKYALSTMLQWLWRSAIREGKEVWLYLPSSRMRTLLTNWLEERRSV